MCHINASLWPDMLEKVLIIAYSPSALFSFLTFYQNSYGIFLPLTQYHFTQLLHPVPDLIPIGHFPPSLTFVFVSMLQQIRNSYSITVSKFLFPLALKRTSNYRPVELEWFHKTFTSVYWETYVKVCPFSAPQQM